MMQGMSGMSGSGMAGMMQGMHAKMQEKFQMADADGSGGISQAELETQISEGGGKMGDKLLENFGEIDSDASGELSESEIKDFASQKVASMMGGMSRGGGLGGLSGGSGSTPNFLDILNSLNEEDDSSSTSLSDLLNEKVSSSGLSDSQVSQLLSRFDKYEEQFSSYSFNA